MINKKNGFTLIEVLITVLVLAIGLLGLAGLQVNSLRNNLSAEQRGKAAQLAYDMTDRMRSNTPGLADYINAKAEDANCVKTPVVGCTPAQLAKHGKFEWERKVGNTLPGGQGAISLSGAIYSVTVSWDDDRDGDIDASDAAFTVSFQP